MSGAAPLTPGALVVRTASGGFTQRDSGYQGFWGFSLLFLVLGFFGLGVSGLGQWAAVGVSSATDQCCWGAAGPRFEGEGIWPCTRSLVWLVILARRHTWNARTCRCGKSNDACGCGLRHQQVAERLVIQTALEMRALTCCCHSRPTTQPETRNPKP